MIKIVLKIFKSNIWNCILCFISSVLVSATLFLFEGIKRMVLGTMSEQERSHSSLGISAQLYIYVLLFIGAILILYTISNYSRVRIRDYGMFMVLGSEKRDILRMVIVEYGVMCAVSYVIGCIIGSFCAIFVKNIMVSEGIDAELSPQMFEQIVSITLFYMLLIFGVAVLLNLINMQRSSLATLMQYKEKKSRIPSVFASIIGGIAGVVILTAALMLLGRQPMTYKRMKYGMLLALAGLYLCFTYLGGLFLLLFKKCEKWYNNHVLKMKNLYYRFSESKNIIMVVFVINFFVLVFVNINVVEYGNTSSEYLWKYPYDYVWMTEQKYVDGIEEAVSINEGETAIYDYVSLESNDGGKYIGISLSTYNQLTDKKKQLNPGEVLAILQKAEWDEEIMFQTPQVYLPEGEGYRQFFIKKETKEILFIGQQSEIIYLLVLNDEDFQAAQAAQDSDTVIITQNVKERGKALEQKLLTAAESCRAVFYSKEALMQKDRQEDMMTLIFYICMGIFLIISNMTVLAIKIWSEIPLLSQKYAFLGKLGMDANEIKKNIKGELSIYLKIPFFLSVFAGLLMLMHMLAGVEMCAVLQVGKLFVLLILLQVLYMAGIREYGYRLMKKRICGEGRG